MSTPEPRPPQTELKTVSNNLEVGDKILAKCSTDRLFHLATVIKIGAKRTQCYVQFESGQEIWCSADDLQQGQRSQGKDIKCCLCHGGVSDPPNEIVLCDMCGLGFHQYCHNPVILASVISSPEIEWFCVLCYIKKTDKTKANWSTVSNKVPSENARMVKSSKLLKKINKNKSAQEAKLIKLKQEKQKKKCAMLDKLTCSYTGSRSSLPYKLGKLSWDKHHLENRENVYCYCKSSGNWFWQMLQCVRCRQWFHQDCVSCLQYPLLLGDRLYVFVCGVCNSGKEYIQRLKLSWDDVVHVMLFHLTMKDHIKYLDMNEVLVPWLIKNWERLQVPQELNCPSQQSVSDYMRSHCLSTMQAKASKYKNGREIKKRYTLWGLRDRFPPFPPVLHLGPGHVTDDMVNQAIKGSNTNRNIAYAGLVVPFRNQDKLRLKKRKADDNDIPPPQPKKRKTSAGNSLISQPNMLNTARRVEDLPSSTNHYAANSGLTNQGPCNNDSPTKISLDYAIPCPSNFYGVNHPFKTILERDEELKHVKMKEQLLSTYSHCNGAVVDGEFTQESDSMTDSHADTESDSLSIPATENIVPEPPNRKPTFYRQLLRNFPKIKRKKRGRPSKAELKALEDRMNAAYDMGITDTNKILQSCPMNLQNHTPKKERKVRTKNVVDKSTLDGMSERQVSLTQLKSSVNNYFGAANRLANGEGFKVLARRRTPDGKCQYLVEWEGGIIG